MSATTDINSNTKLQFVVMRWDIDSEDGYHFVGPFPDVHIANRWGAYDEDTCTNSPCWHTELIDPTSPLPIKAPDRLGDLTLDPKPYGWQETSAICVSAGTGWYLIMTDAEPLHIVGPFVFHRVAHAWGRRNEAEGASYGWQVIWLWDPTAPIKLIEPGVFVDAE